MEYHPNTTLSDSSPIEFAITGSEYVDLSETYLQVTAKIVKPDGGNLAQTSGMDGTVTGMMLMWKPSIYGSILFSAKWMSV